MNGGSNYLEKVKEKIIKEEKATNTYENFVYSKEILEKLLLDNGKDSGFKDVHVVAYNTISGEAKKMTVFSADKLVINSGKNEYITNRFMIGVSYKVFQDAISYDLLLNSSLM